jgi:hypothetical protein
MRKRASWMKPADDPILEYVHDAGEVTPAVIARNVELDRKYTGVRCRELTNYGMLDSDDSGFYWITEAGEQYLAGELDAGDLDSDG